SLLSPFASIAWAADAARPDSASASTPASPWNGRRVSWTSDRLPLQTGDIITVVVDEQTAAREKVSRIATGDRSQKAGFRIDQASSDPTDIRVGTGMNASSRDVGEATHQGDLTTVMTVRVKNLEPNGVAQIEGSRKVTVDGRVQEIDLQGMIRS